MKITLPNGTTIEGTEKELKPWLPPVPQRNWDGSPKITCIIPTSSDGGFMDESRIYGGWAHAPFRGWD